MNRRTPYRYFAAVLAIGLALVAEGAQAQVVISEFMAVNDTTLVDEDGDYPDWIELLNAGSTDVDLDGWYLTDNAGNLRKWRFPHVVIEPDDYLIVFASTKDRATAGEELHTDFKLGGDGEYLALVRPDGLTVASAFAPEYPPQVADISYGLVYATTQTLLVATGETCRYLGPADEGLGNAWTATDFDDSGWATGPTGVGYDNNDGSVLPYIATDVEAATPGSTLYLRMPFTLGSLQGIRSLHFRARYRDGFVVYINGTEVTRDRAPETPRWDSEATGEFTGMDVESFPVANPGSSLVAGTNVLAIHAMNVPGRFPDFLMAPELELALLSTSVTAAVETYLFAPSPGDANGDGSTELAPRFSGGPAGAPAVGAGESLVVSQRVDETLYPIDEVRVVYRIMFGAEATLALNDSGVAGDAAAGDSVFSGTIPLGGLGAGEMIRWRFEAEDDHGQAGQFPLFADPLDSPQYFGTVALDTSIVSRLPVVHWFVESPSAANNRTGTRACLWYLDRFYDNIHVNRHGQSTGTFPKKSYNLDFNRGNRFVFREGEDPVKDVDFLTNWADKSKCRNTLAYEFYEHAGSPCHFAFPIRVQQNAAFFSVADMVEDGDDRYTDRVGLDPDGALYKMYNRCDSWTSGVEKKTRKEEDNSDLQALVLGLNPGDANRDVYMYDHVDIPRAVNYLATRPIINDRDHGHKNYYLYRDTDGNGEWIILHWDVDLCLGHVWRGGVGYYDDTIYTEDEIIYNRNNRFYDVIYDTPETRTMVLRRIRTLMDTLLRPPGTAPQDGYMEPRIAELLELIDPEEEAESDADRDLAKWGNWGNMDNMRQGCDRIVNEFLPGRRAFLWGLVTNGTLPDAQPPDACVDFGRIEFLPASGVQDEEFVELVNTNDYAVDVSGWSLDGGISITLNGGTVIAAGQSLFVSPDVNDFRRRVTGPTGGRSCFVQGDYKGQLADRGETVELRNERGVLVNSVRYTGLTNTYAGGLRVSEIMYHPVDGGSEFVEIVNTGGTTADLGEIVLTGGIGFDFYSGSIASLGPGKHAVVVRDLTAFTNRYGAAVAASIAGVYTGSLNNAGDAVRLADLGDEAIIFSCDYNDARGWPLTADGAGHSLVPLVMSDQASGLPDYGGNWRGSTHIGGSPGAADPVPPRSVVVNEVGAHTDTGLDPPYDSDDWIELYNPTDTAVDIGGWYLSDRAEDLMRYRLPPGMIIASNSYLVLTENLHFHTNRHAETGFGLNKAGDELFLSHLPGGSSNRVVDCVRFKGQLNGVALGRSPDADPYWYALTPTTNAANAASDDRIVISEIMFDPAAATNGEDNTRDEYIELFNATTGSVTLSGSAGGWRIDGGVSYTFASNTVLPAGGALLIVSFDPATNGAALAAFKSAHGIVGFEPVMAGPYDGKLSNTGERLALEKPQEPDMPGEGVSWVIVDEAIYFDKWPWPEGARGTGRPLQRLPGPGAGNNPDNWRVPAVGSPGTGPARIALTLPEYGREFLVPFSTLVRAEVDTYQVSGTVHEVAFFEGSNSLFVDTVAPYECIYAASSNKGSYTFRAELTDDAGVHTSAVSVVSAVGPLTVDDEGASDITLTSVDMHGRFEGCDYVDATLFWGPNDGGTNAAAWQRSAFVGRVPAEGGTLSGRLSVSLEDLSPGLTYHYRWRVARARGERWSADAQFSAAAFSAWPHRMRVTFSGYDGASSLTGFPVLVRLGTGIPGFSYAGFAAASGADLRFSNAGATQRLYHEIEAWDTNGESSVWVRMPELAGTGTAVVAYWGNANAAMPPYCTNGAVWSENFKAVWHLNGDFLEASGNGPDAADQGTAPGDGVVAGARAFDGTAAYVEPGLSTTWYAQNMQSLTISAWARPGANHDGTVLGSSSTSGDLAIGCISGRFPDWAFAVTSVVKRIPLTVSQWQYLAMVLDAGQARAGYNDDAPMTIGAYGEFTPDVAPLLGCLAVEGGSPTTFFNGRIDEVRIATTARSADWIRTEYRTVVDGFAEYAVLPSLPVDADGDGLPDEWEVLYFGGIHAVPGGHGDTDGMPNDDEFTAGTDPTNAESRLVIDLVLSNGVPLVRFNARKASGPGYAGRERYYGLDSLPGLPPSGPWLPVPGMSNLLGQDQVVTYPAPPDTQHLYRVRARLTSPP